MATVFKFERYNITTDKYDPSVEGVMVTREAAIREGLSILEETGIKVDDAKLDAHGFFRKD